MALLNVNPTRMELKKLKVRLATARRGHKLLKDKRDELMKQFLDIVKDNRKLRRRVENGLIKSNSNIKVASAIMSSEMIEQSLLYPKQRVSLGISFKNVMSVNVPVYDYKTLNDDTSDVYPYGFAFTSGELDDSIGELSQVFSDMLKLAQMEKSVQLLAAEIEKTRRRVNALEYVSIPQMEETIKYITMKLDETERGNITRLMKVKDMMVAEAILAKQKRDAAIS